MPKQNRVTPCGDLVAVAARGTMMGNRGVLHDAEQHIVRPWQVRRWIVCELEFRGRRRQVMAPGRYTELFFLDEATALASGHRPCFECRRASFHEFQRAWQRAHLTDRPPTADAMDHVLHAERIGLDRTKKVFEAELAWLQDGVFVRRRGHGETAYLIWHGELLAWSPGGYTDRVTRPRLGRVTVLTPPATVSVFRAGYVPTVHPSSR